MLLGQKKVESLVAMKVLDCYHMLDRINKKSSGKEEGNEFHIVKRSYRIDVDLCSRLWLIL